MRRFAPDPETSGAVTTLRVFEHVNWTSQHRAGRLADPLATLSTIALALGAVLLYVSILGAVALGIYATLTWEGRGMNKLYAALTVLFTLGTLYALYLAWRRTRR